MQQNLNTGTRGDKNTGDDLNAAAVKIEANFTDLYTSKLDLAGGTMTGNLFTENIVSNSTNEGIGDLSSGDGSNFFNHTNVARHSIHNGSGNFWNVNKVFGDHLNIYPTSTFLDTGSNTYTLHNTGTPTETTDLITKAYADAFFETGTFTPTLTASGGTYTITTANGAYSRVNKTVTFNVALIGINTTVVPSGPPIIGGLPYTSRASDGYFVYPVMTGNSDATFYSLTGIQVLGSDTIGFGETDSLGDNNTSTGNPMGPITFTAGVLYVSGSYIID